MNDRPRLLLRLDYFLLLSMSWAAAGCSEELGPERLPVAPVSGVVREGSRPLTGGWIEVIPVDQTVGNLRSAKLGADGSFSAERVPVGVNLIRLINTPLHTPGAMQILGSYQSPIRREVKERATEPLLIDVMEELIHYRSTLGPSAAPASEKTGGGR